MVLRFWRGWRSIHNLGALGEPDFRRLYVARAFSLFGDGLVPVALPFAVLSIDRSPAGLGFVLASRSLSLVVFLLVAGVIADRLARKYVLIASDLVRLMAQGVMAGLLIGGAARLWHLIALTFIYGIGDAFFRPTSTGFVPETVSRERLQQANALLALTSSGFSILGPVVAGVLVVTIGAGWALAADAATFLLSVAFLLPIRAVGADRGTHARFWHELRAGWRIFRSRTWLWVDGVFSALGSFAVLAPLLALGPIVAQRSLGGAPAWATIVAAFGIGSVLGGMVLLRVQPARPLRAGVPLLALLALPTSLLALRDNRPAAHSGGRGLTRCLDRLGNVRGPATPRIRYRGSARHGGGREKHACRFRNVDCSVDRGRSGGSERQKPRRTVDLDR
ncbi:MAG: MFS transporter [Chloroflexi bacterium]|nr:MAG: MFS transporter [Chloroflexota bacterium]